MNQQLQQPPSSQVFRLEDFVSAEAGPSTAPVDSTNTQPVMTHGSGVQGTSAQGAHAGLLPAPFGLAPADHAHVSVCIVNGEDMNSIMALSGRTELDLFPFSCPWCGTVFCLKIYPDGSFELDETESGQPVPWAHGVHVNHAFCPACVYTGFVFEVEMERARHP